MDKYKASGRQLFMVFVNLKKAFDRIPRKMIWCAIRWKGVVKNNSVIIEMYKNSRTAVKVEGVTSEWFDVNVDVHQELTLSFFLFAVVMDEITKDVNDEL